MPPLKHSLNPDAIAAADAALAKETGGRKLTMSPEDTALREKWVQAYLNSGGERAGGNGPRPPEAIKTSCLPCQHKGTFLGRYLYADRTPIVGATYVIYGMGDQELGRGTTDGQGRLKAEGINTTIHASARFEVHEDPAPQKYEIVPTKNHEPAEVSASWLDNVFDWSWGTLQGDFNQEQTLSQIVVNAVIGLVPVVDQAMDVRDIVANLYHLINFYLNENERTEAEIQEDNEAFFGLGKELELWFNLVITAIGTIPTVGSAAKGVLKAIFHQARRFTKNIDAHKLKQMFDAVAETLNKYGKFDAKKWLKSDLKPNLAKWCDEAKDRIKKAINALDDALGSIQSKFKNYSQTYPGYDRVQELLKRMEQWKSVIPKLRGKVDTMVDRVRKELDEWIEKLLGNKLHSSRGGPIDGQEHVLQQLKREPPHNTVTSRFWRKSKQFKGNKVFQRDDLIDPKKMDSKGRTNVLRMKKGLAPLGPDGKPINLHHMLQAQDGAIAEMTQTFHQKNSKIIHINPNTTPSGIDRKTFDSWKRDYWKDRAKDFGE
jgi:hypothetical protein